MLSPILLLTPDIEIRLTWSSNRDLLRLAFRLGPHDTDREFWADNFILIERLAAPGVRHTKLGAKLAGYLLAQGKLPTGHAENSSDGVPPSFANSRAQRRQLGNGVTQNSRI